jgi:hypothetical protein
VFVTYYVVVYFDRDSDCALRPGEPREATHGSEAWGAHDSGRELRPQCINEQIDSAVEGRLSLPFARKSPFRSRPRPVSPHCALGGRSLDHRHRPPQRTADLPASEDYQDPTQKAERRQSRASVEPCGHGAPRRPESRRPIRDQTANLQPKSPMPTRALIARDCRVMLAENRGAPGPAGRPSRSNTPPAVNRRIGQNICQMAYETNLLARANRGHAPIAHVHPLPRFEQRGRRSRRSSRLGRRHRQ